MPKYAAYIKLTLTLEKLKLHSMKMSSMYIVWFAGSMIGMGTKPIPSINTVDTCELRAIIDTSVSSEGPSSGNQPFPER